MVRSPLVMAFLITLFFALPATAQDAPSPDAPGQEEGEQPAAEEAAPAAEAGAGKLELFTDSDGISAEVGETVVELEPGIPIVVDVPAGTAHVTFLRDGKTVHEADADVAANATTKASYLSLGELVVEGTGEAAVTVKLGDDTHKVGAGESVSLPVGSQTVEIGVEGKIPVRGDLELRGGEVTTVTVAHEPTADVSFEETLGWTGLGIGFALVATTLVVDQTVDFDDNSTEDAVQWTLMGLGSAFTIAGGVLVKEAFNATHNPEPQDVEFDFRVGIAPTSDGNGGLLSGFLRF